MPSSSSSDRLTSKQADVQDRRNRMTQRRQELTHKIRKQKKSEYLARKRNLPIASTSDSTSSATHPVGNTTTLIHSYCQNPTNDTLQALHQALQSTTTLVVGTEENPLLFLSQEEQSKAVALLECLRTHASTDQLPSVLQILVPLTAISYNPSSSYYYGYTPVSWCTLLAQDSQWLSLLVSIVPREEAACVILGNLVGEGSSQVCPALRQAGMVRALVSAIHQYPAAATWALTNAIRNDTTAWASTYCADDLLSPQLLEHLLQQQPPVATQAAWMIASLTSREEAVVQYLVRHSSFCQTLVMCLERPVSKDQSVPLVQALGHIASYEDLVIPLLSSLPSLVPLVGQLLLQQQPKDLVIQIAWLSGCLLCDAGLVDHPSTTLAAPALVPVLFQRLATSRDNTTTTTTTTTSLEEKRELACALRNALSLPPTAAADPKVPVVPVPLPSVDIIGLSLSTLVDLISSVDSDAVLAALHAVDSLLHAVDDLLLRRVLLTLLEEANIEAALESVCDNTALEAAGEVAANLLDDYFFDDDNEEEDLPLPDVGFGGPRPGMGRGRGATLPSWMPEN